MEFTYYSLSICLAQQCFINPSFLFLLLSSKIMRLFNKLHNSHMNIQNVFFCAFLYNTFGMRRIF
jgi:hypothetical protein